MAKSTNRARVLLIIALALLAIVVPYLVAWRISPAGTVFTGFLINPIDGFSYLAKMRQGFDGSWRFELPYTADPGSGSFLFIFYLALGHLSRILDIPLIVTYHGSRVILSAGFFVLLYLFYDRMFEENGLMWGGFLLSLFGSGLGWLAITVFNRQSIDVWVPEAFPFLSAYTNPHFPLAAGAFIGGILLVYLRGQQTWRQWILASICGFVLGAVLPFVTVPLFLVLGAWIIWERLRIKAAKPSGWLLQEPLRLTFLALGALPWLVYDYWLSVNHPVLSHWNMQNLTPSPPLIDTTLGFGFVFWVALISLLWRPWRAGRTGRLFTIWYLLGFILLYAPLPYQRRFGMGLYLPMAGLAVWWLRERFVGERRFRLAMVVLLASSIPTLLLVMLAGTTAVARGEEAILFSTNELKAYEWIESQVPSESLVLTDPKHGNRLPAFAHVRVLYGHPFETPDAEFWRDSVRSLLAWEGAVDAALDVLDEYSVAWVLYDRTIEPGSESQWIKTLPVRSTFDGIEVLEIIVR
jgi:hypothetical protein